MPNGSPTNLEKNSHLDNGDIGFASMEPEILAQLNIRVVYEVGK